jgi:tetratricopeptide (TPR) repeat protein
MLFAPDWKRDIENQATTEPPLSPAFTARWAAELLARGELKQALERALTGTEQFPTYSSGWFVLAKVQAALELHRDATASLERCLAIEPEFFAAWDLLSEVLTRLGRKAAARAAADRYRELLGALAPTPEEATPIAAPRPDSDHRATPSEAQPAREVRKIVYKGPQEITRAFETPTLAEVYRRQGLLDRALEVYTRILTRHPEDTGARAMVQKLHAEISSRRKPQEQQA